jgi:hypothetical protein
MIKSKRFVVHETRSSPESLVMWYPKVGNQNLYNDLKHIHCKRCAILLNG